MSARTAKGLAGLVMATVALSACHDGAGKHTETTQVRITGTPKAGYSPPTRHEAARPAGKAPDAGPDPKTGVRP